VSDKILIIDFEDSFTYNVASVLYPLEQSVSVINVHDFFTHHFEKFLSEKNLRAIILGPGPGHPEIYQDYFQKIEELRKTESIYTMGICLGHQILGMMDGKKVLKSSEQIHGQTITINFKDTSLKVQRYNSLAVVDGSFAQDIRRFPRGISYQFHPESIGTENNLLFFEELLEFIHGEQGDIARQDLIV